MQGCLLLTALVTTCVLGNAQYHSSHFLAQRSFNGDTVSSSWVKSFSWFKDQDGQMHQQSEETSSEIVQDGFGTRQTHSQSSSWIQARDGQMHQQSQETSSELVQDNLGTRESSLQIACEDGNCHKVVMVALPPTVQAVVEVQIPPISPCMLSFLSEIAEYMSSPPTEVVPERQEDTRQPDMFVGAAVENEMPPQVVIIGAQERHEKEDFEEDITNHLNGKSEGRQRLRGDFEVRPAMQHEQAGQPQADPWLHAHWHKFKYVILRGAFFTVVMALTAYMVLSAFRGYAREQSVRPLSESLIADSGEELADSMYEMPDAAISSHKATPLSIYLTGLYARASMKSESAWARKRVLHL